LPGFDLRKVELRLKGNMIESRVSVKEQLTSVGIPIVVQIEKDSKFKASAPKRQGSCKQLGVL
jgi:hypothetical protein